MHRDIKPQNLLLELDAKEEVKGLKVADFGLARFEHDPERGITTLTDHKKHGTPCYRAPEMLEEGRITIKTDVYCFGAAMLHICTRIQPWDGLKIARIGQQVLNGKKPSTLDTLQPEPLQKLLRDCLAYEGVHRPTMQDVLERLRDIHDMNED